ncbi:MAG: HAD family acid phosphatase, partial [Ginsengibacter sp.]
MQKLMLIICLFAFQKINAQDSSATLSQRDLKIYPVLWQQDAAEYRALCYQAFNIAQARVDEITKDPGTQKLAIITDLDETILDNSDMAAEKIKEGKVTTAKWLKWLRKPTIPTVPGAVDFLNYAAKKGITIFY